MNIILNNIVVTANTDNESRPNMPQVQVSHENEERSENNLGQRKREKASEIAQKSSESSKTFMSKNALLQR